jgi:hypothetical protein
MRAFLITLPLMAIVLVQIARATDVDYNLGNIGLSDFAEQNVAKPFSDIVKDRAWVAGGIEERVDNANLTFWHGTGPRIRFEFSPQSSHVSYQMPETEERAPDWIGDALWPRTKEVLHYGNVPRPKLEPLEALPFGLQR